MTAANDDSLRELRIELMPAGGVVVWVAGSPFAAFSSARELCLWLEAELTPLTGAADASADEALPAVLQSPARQPARSGTLSRVGAMLRGG